MTRGIPTAVVIRITVDETTTESITTAGENDWTTVEEVMTGTTMTGGQVAERGLHLARESRSLTGCRSIFHVVNAFYFVMDLLFPM